VVGFMTTLPHLAKGNHLPSQPERRKKKGGGKKRDRGRLYLSGAVSAVSLHEEGGEKGIL